MFWMATLLLKHAWLQPSIHLFQMQLLKWPFDAYSMKFISWIVRKMHYQIKTQLLAHKETWLAILVLKKTFFVCVLSSA